MRSFVNPFARRAPSARDRLADIKTWVREAAGLADGYPVAVAELTCGDAGCPDLETVIGILHKGQPTEVIRVHARIAAVTQADVAAAVNAARTGSGRDGSAISR